MGGAGRACGLIWSPVYQGLGFQDSVTTCLSPASKSTQWSRLHVVPSRNGPSCQDLWCRLSWDARTTSWTPPTLGHVPRKLWACLIHASWFRPELQKQRTLGPENPSRSPVSVQFCSRGRQGCVVTVNGMVGGLDASVCSWSSPLAACALRASSLGAPEDSLCLRVLVTELSPCAEHSAS